MAASREHILREIRRLADVNGGGPVGVRRFTADTGIAESEWMGRYWARWSEAVREAGYEPGEWQAQVYSDDELLRILAELTRQHGHIPTIAEVQMRKRAHPDQPGPDVFRRRFGGKISVHDRLQAFADADPDFADVAGLLAAARPASRKVAPKVSPERVVTGVVYLLSMGEFYKIGKSNDPGRRIYEVGLRLPAKHDVVHLIETDDPSGIEAYWHRRFASQRANGEWFRLSGEDVAAFARRTYM